MKRLRARGSASKFLARALCLASAVLLFDCGGSAAVRPETTLASAIAQFQKSAGDFTDARREIMRARQSLLDGSEADTTRARLEVDQVLGIWRMAGEKDKLMLYENLLLSTSATGVANKALRELLESHRRAESEASSKVNLSQEQLAAAIRALTSLGTKKSLAEQVEFYMDLVDATKRQVDELKAKVDAEKKAATEGGH